MRSSRLTLCVCMLCAQQTVALPPLLMRLKSVQFIARVTRWLFRDSVDFRAKILEPRLDGKALEKLG